MTATSTGRGRARLITVGAIAGAIGILAVPGLVNAQETGIIGPPPPDPQPTLPPGPGDIAIPDPGPTLPPGPGDLAIPDPQPTLPPGPGDLAIPDPGAGNPDGGGDVPAGGEATADPVVGVDAAAAAAVAPAAAAPAAPGGQLPETGLDSTVLVVVGVTLTAAGTAMVTLARRRNPLAQG